MLISIVECVVLLFAIQLFLFAGYFLAQIYTADKKSNGN